MSVRDLIAAMDTSVPAGVREVAEGLVYRDFMTVGMLLKRMNLTSTDDRSYPPPTPGNIFRNAT